MRIVGLLTCLVGNPWLRRIGLGRGRSLRWLGRHDHAVETLAQASRQQEKLFAVNVHAHSKSLGLRGNKSTTRTRGWLLLDGDRKADLDIAGPTDC